jgi:OFA family oxalate/formate antiporter-like MFS transporter
MSKLHHVLAYFLYNSCLAIFLTYGLFFNRVAADFGQSPTSTSLVFATFAILYGLSSLLMGLLLDRIGPSKTILLGGSLMGAGLVLSSLANSLPILVFTYGVIAGGGTGSMWPTTSYAVFDKFNTEEVRTVTGVVSAGTAFGSLFFAPLEAFLISSIQWRQTFVVLGVIVVAFAVAAAAAAWGSKGRGTHAILSALPDVRTKRFGFLYAYYTLGNAFSRSLVMVFIVPMLEFYGASIFLGSLALSMIGAGSIFGRFAAGVKWLSEEQILGLSFIVQGISTLFLLYGRDLVTVAVFSLFFGVGYGGYIPQFALIIRKYFGLKTYGAILGLLLTSYAVGAFAGPIFEAFSLEASGTFAIGFYVAALTSSIVGLHQLAWRRMPSVRDYHDL